MSWKIYLDFPEKKWKFRKVDNRHFPQFFRKFIKEKWHYFILFPEFSFCFSFGENLIEKNFKNDVKCQYLKINFRRNNVGFSIRI
jgi:hypothetical protein